MGSFLNDAVQGGIVGAIAVVCVALLIPRKLCPNCGERLPRFRNPQSVQQAMRGEDGRAHTAVQKSLETDHSPKVTKNEILADHSPLVGGGFPGCR